MIRAVDHINGVTFHGRKGSVQNAFRYTIDYVLVDAESQAQAPTLFTRNGRGLTALNDQDHGGKPKHGRGAAWAREVLKAHEISAVARIELLAQPKVLGHVFNPVSFWLCRREHDDELIAVIAEVSNTFGDRHSYLVHHKDLRPIKAVDRMTAKKLMHVSPFQPVEGGYEFRFDIRDDRIGIWIDYSQGNGGVIATLTGKRRPLTNWAIVQMLVRRPLGSRRVLGLIHWQALKLWWKKATFRPCPEAPAQEVSRG
jgi:DUF1365 family protein